jgi:hypothetical protein
VHRRDHPLGLPVQHLLHVPTVLPDEVLEVRTCPRGEVLKFAGEGIVRISTSSDRPTPPDGLACSHHQCTTDST